MSNSDNVVKEHAYLIGNTGNSGSEIPEYLVSLQSPEAGFGLEFVDCLLPCRVDIRKFSPELVDLTHKLPCQLESLTGEFCNYISDSKTLSVFLSCLAYLDETIEQLETRNAAFPYDFPVNHGQCEFLSMTFIN